MFSFFFLFLYFLLGFFEFGFGLLFLLFFENFLFAGFDLFLIVLVELDDVLVCSFYIEFVDVAIFRVWLESFHFVGWLVEQMAEIDVVEVVTEIIIGHEENSIFSHLTGFLQSL